MIFYFEKKKVKILSKKYLGRQKKSLNKKYENFNYF